MVKPSWKRANTITIFKMKDIKAKNYKSVIFNSILPIINSSTFCEPLENSRQCGQHNLLKEKIMLNQHIFLLQQIAGQFNEEKSNRSIMSLFDNILHDISMTRLGGNSNIILMELF